MVLQETGWPLGLRPLNARIGLVRNQELSGSNSFSTLLTGSPSFTADSSSDLDIESTGSFFHDKSITLGSLIRVSSILELSRRSTRRIRTAETLRDKKNCKSKPWFFSLCSKLSSDDVNENDTPSLGHFLEEERRAANIQRRESPMLNGPDDFSPDLPNRDLNSLFVGGQVASSSLGADGGRRSSTELLEQGNGYGFTLFFSCLCGQLIE